MPKRLKRAKGNEAAVPNLLNTGSNGQQWNDAMDTTDCNFSACAQQLKDDRVILSRLTNAVIEESNSNITDAQVHLLEFMDAMIELQKSYINSIDAFMSKGLLPRSPNKNLADPGRGLIALAYNVIADIKQQQRKQTLSPLQQASSDVFDNQRNRTEESDQTSDINPRLLDEYKSKIASNAWQPSDRDLDSGRKALMEIYQDPDMLLISKYAELANKTRQQIHRDVQDRKLLSINIGKRGTKIPKWQIDDTKRELTQKLIVATNDVLDNWTLYQALTRPLDYWDGKCALDVVTRDTVIEVLNSILASLGLQRFIEHA